MAHYTEVMLGNKWGILTYTIPTLPSGDSWYCTTDLGGLLMDLCGTGCIDPRILNLGTSWSVVSFTPRSLYPRGKASGAHRIGGWVGHRTGLNDAERKTSYPLPRLELRPIGRPARSQSLYRLPNTFQNWDVHRRDTWVKWQVTPVSNSNDTKRTDSEDIYLHHVYVIITGQYPATIWDERGRATCIQPNSIYFNEHLN
jgi:hypothetical protein